MTLNEFQLKVFANWRPPKDVPGLLYVSNAMVGEAGECANVIKKFYRDDAFVSRAEDLKLELGDTLHYLADLAALAGFSLEDVAKANFKKLGITYAD